MSNEVLAKYGMSNGSYGETAATEPAVDPANAGQELYKKIASGVASSLEMTPEEAAEIPTQVASLGALKEASAGGKSARQLLYDTLNERGTKLGDEKIKLLQQMNEDAPMSKSQIAAMVLVGALPILAGGMIKG